MKILMNAHCVLYGINKSLRAILFLTFGGLIMFVDTNCSTCLLNSELTKLTMEFSFSMSSSCHRNKTYITIHFGHNIIYTICTWTTSGMFFRKSKTVS